MKASQTLKHLRDLGIIEIHGKSTATYYTLKQEFYSGQLKISNQNSLSGQLKISNQDSSTPNQDSLSGQLKISNQDSSTPNQDSLSGQLKIPNQDSSTQQAEQLTLELFPSITQESLEEKLNQLGGRETSEEMKALILELCKIKPHSSSELAIRLKRRRKYLLAQYLKPLINEELLEYTNPDNPNDPHQTYRTIQK